MTVCYLVTPKYELHTDAAPRYNSTEQTTKKLGERKSSGSGQS